MRLIDADALKNREIVIDYDEVEDTFDDGLLFVADLIDKSPTVDAAEVRHGGWVASYTEHTFSDGSKARWNIWKCSRCPYVRTAGWEYTTEGQKPKARFCENCGARMDGEEIHNAILAAIKMVEDGPAADVRKDSGKKEKD